MEQLKQWIADFASSEYALFLEPRIKEHAEAILSRWLADVGDSETIVSTEAALNALAHLDLALRIRQEIPTLLAVFCDYCLSVKGYSQAGVWKEHIELLESSWLEQFRDDGTVRGETFRKQYAEVGRNDPCPCGSGKKFKKCCMKLTG